MKPVQRVKRIVESIVAAIAVTLVASLSGEIGGALSAVYPRYSFQLIKQDDPLPPYEPIAGGGQVWDLWRGTFESEPPVNTRDSGTRGTGFCIIAPVEAEGYVVAESPTFVWRGSAEQIEIEREDGTISPVDLEESTVTTFPPLDDTGDVIYAYSDDEMRLEPGAFYRWRIKAQGLSFSPWRDFYVVDAEAQAQIRDDLFQIEREMTGESAEAIAIARANYLAENQLWSDFWREVLSVENPSENLTNVVQELTQNLCDPVPSGPAPAP